MADDNAAPAANETAAPEAPAKPESGSPTDIAAFLGARRAKPPQNNEPATPARAGAAEAESPPQGEDTEPHSEAPGETEESGEAGEPPIAAPRTWSAAEKAAFATLPREFQQSIADRESERDAHYQRGHNEAAEKFKAAEAKEAAAEQARQQYEQALPQLLTQFQSQFAAEFSDLKTWDDVTKMQSEDPMRFQRWQLMREQGQSLQTEAQQAEQRQRQDAERQWNEFSKAEDQKFVAVEPDYADPKKAAQMVETVRSTLTDLGFKPEELEAAYFGDRRISFRDHRIQRLAVLATKYLTAQKALKAAKPAPVPPVQRPGTPTPQQRMPVGQDRLQELTAKARKSGAPRDIAEIIRAKRLNSEKAAKAS